jgi:hypothetical protein
LEPIANLIERDCEVFCFFAFASGFVDLAWRKLRIAKLRQFLGTFGNLALKVDGI